MYFDFEEETKARAARMPVLSNEIFAEVVHGLFFLFFFCVCV